MEWMKVFSQSLPPSLISQKFGMPSFSGELFSIKVCFCYPFLSRVADQYCVCAQGHIASIMTQHESLDIAFNPALSPSLPQSTISVSDPDLDLLHLCSGSTSWDGITLQACIHPLLLGSSQNSFLTLSFKLWAKYSPKLFLYKRHNELCPYQELNSSLSKVVQLQFLWTRKNHFIYSFKLVKTGIIFNPSWSNLNRQ